MIQKQRVRSNRPLRWSMLGSIWICMFASALGQPALPAGWTSQAAGGALVLTSPPDWHGARLTFAILPSGHPQGELKDWYDRQTRVLLKAVGQEPTEIGNVVEDNGILVRTVTFEKRRMAIYGYPTAGGLSVSILSIPSSVGLKDRRAEAAVAYARQLAAQKYELTETVSSAAIQPRQSPGQPRQYVGQFGRSDIDLTYHAKGIPPPDHDVPLKGVYMFVGYAFGPTYGGVGTTMTWGQHAVQQLLLLYSNGVAAKVDFRGGNLAGKYQAEGFVTMDVSNPAAVSGAPYGQWAEDETRVHIHWNIGAPTELAKNGPNLEGKGERWVPYRLVDGQRLEGTFVRKMEAGLRSQWIMLHPDGTFSGDGVNVTMGGSVVNPAFPERGSGRYEIRKGSMILYYANGYTQAIACILDNPDNVRTVLLNGFPFERVR